MAGQAPFCLIFPVLMAFWLETCRRKVFGFVRQMNSKMAYFSTLDSTLYRRSHFYTIYQLCHFYFTIILSKSFGHEGVRPFIFDPNYRHLPFWPQFAPFSSILACFAGRFAPLASLRFGGHALGGEINWLFHFSWINFNLMDFLQAFSLQLSLCFFCSPSFFNSSSAFNQPLRLISVFHFHFEFILTTKKVCFLLFLSLSLSWSV